jgi:hypothetical protein
MSPGCHCVLDRAGPVLGLFDAAIETAMGAADELLALALDQHIARLAIGGQLKAGDFQRHAVDGDLVAGQFVMADMVQALAVIRRVQKSKSSRPVSSSVENEAWSSA